MSDVGELKPCPGCASSLGPFLTAPDGKTQVVCSTCGMRGPYETVHVSAAAHFNALPRADAPLTPADAVRCPEVTFAVAALQHAAQNMPHPDPMIDAALAPFITPGGSP